MATFKANKKNISALRNLDTLRAPIEQCGKEIQGRANSMFGCSSYRLNTEKHKGGWHTLIYTGDKYAVRSNAIHNTLQKAVR